MSTIAAQHVGAPRTFEGARVVVMGLGNFGGGAGVARWLAQQGASVLLTDVQPEEALRASLAPLADYMAQGRITTALGGHNVADFTTCDMVVANPAVPKPWDNRFLRAARAAGIPITTEIRLVTERLPARERVIGITGSAGKSTTTAMISHMLARLGERVHTGGNIGGSLLNAVSDVSPADWVVLELSSAMLHWLGEGAGWEGAPGWSPAIGVLTNLSPNHGDWHGTHEHYSESKINLFRYGCARAVLGPAVEASLAERVRGMVNWTAAADEAFTHEVGTRAALRIPGAHNIVNAATACLAVAAASQAENPRAAGAALAPLLADFAGLPHRLECVGRVRGVTYYNDSKSTTPESCLLAARAFAGTPGLEKVHLIAGGYDKKSDLSPVGALAPLLAGLYTIGATGADIARAARGAGGEPHECETLARALACIADRAAPGDVVLLSPACASWDQFTNYEQRGAALRDWVRAAGAEEAGS